MGLFDEILVKTDESSTKDSNKVIILDPGVNRAFCEDCREIINLLKVDTWTCICGNTWKLAPQF